MKSIQLTERQISAVVNYLLGTELSINAALQACYIEAEEPGYLANELDSISQYHLEERIFRCTVCNVWSKMFDAARETILHGEEPACEICSMSSEDICDSDSQFFAACGILTEELTVAQILPLCADIAMGVRPILNDRLLITDADLDFLLTCGIRVRLSPKDMARRKLKIDRRGKS
jgi:hypothetical protein